MTEEQIREPKTIILQGGTFTMGKDGGYLYEKPAHKVYIKSFAIGIYPVTFSEFDYFCKPFRFKPYEEGWGRGSRPVINVTWGDATAYCQWLYEKTGTPYRLPSEAEWEYACRAGSEGDYCFGNNVEKLKDYAWYNVSSNRQTHPVGTKQPNAWGLYDVHGNVWEWCQDTYCRNYRNAHNDGSAREDMSTSDRVIRGGSWFDDYTYNQSTSRLSGCAPYNKHRTLGFRVAYSLK